MSTWPPSRAKSEIVRRMWTRPAGSAPESGSSRIRISGWWARACASFARWRMPRLYPLVGRCAAPERPTTFKAAVASWRAFAGDIPSSRKRDLDELLSREPSVELILFRTVAEAPLQGDVVPRVLAEQRDLALVRVELPDEELEQGALARAVRPHEAGDSLAEGRGEGIEAEHLAIPLRDGRGLDDAVHPVITSTALIRRYVTSAARTVTPSNTASAASQSIAVGVAPNATLATAT